MAATTNQTGECVNTPTHSPASVAYITFKGLCPACGMGKLFQSLLKMHNTCPHCGLNLAEREVGDGPAFLAILIIGALTAIGATVADIRYEIPLWLHAVIWIPCVMIGSIVTLRWLKAWMLAVQYQYRKDDFNH